MVTAVMPLLLLVTRILDAQGLRYVVDGSLAISQYGDLQTTTDIEMMLDLPPEQVSGFVGAMQRHLDLGEEAVRAAVDAGRPFGAMHVDWHVRVEFVPMGLSTLDVQTMARRRAVRLAAEPTRDIYFASAEDSIVRNIARFRTSKEPLDPRLRNVLGILKVQGADLDMGYLRARANEIDVSGLLDRCCQEAGL